MPQEQTTYTLHLPERIDSQNAAAYEEELIRLTGEYPGKVPVFDATDLTYISSAGLRVFMKLSKKLGTSFRILEVSPEVYDIFDTTGFTELLQVKKRLRRISVEGCEVIGRGFYGTVYRLDPDTIVKCYSDSDDAIPMIENEKKMAKMAFLKGIPTAISFDIVKVEGTGQKGDTYGSVFELLKAESFNDRMVKAKTLAEKEQILREYVALLKQAHGTLMDPDTLPKAVDKFKKCAQNCAGYLSKEQIGKVCDLLNALPEDLHLVHGDVQMKNVMMSDGEAMLIDMDTLSTGQPLYDFAGLFMTYQAFEEDDPGNSMMFLNLPQETVDLMWTKILQFYFEDKTPQEMERITDKIRLLGYVYFLSFITSVPDLKAGELGEKRIRHSIEHITELLLKVNDLEL